MDAIAKYYVYILACENGAYYTGYTSDLTRRYQAHCQGTANCKFTRSFKPLYIAQSWQIDGTKGHAMKIESFIKKLPRDRKTQLIQTPTLLVELFPTIAHHGKEIS